MKFARIQVRREWPQAVCALVWERQHLPFVSETWNINVMILDIEFQWKLGEKVANKTHLFMSVHSHKPTKNHLPLPFPTFALYQHPSLSQDSCFHLRRAVEPSVSLENVCAEETLQNASHRGWISSGSGVIWKPWQNPAHGRYSTLPAQARR